MERVPLLRAEIVMYKAACRRPPEGELPGSSDRDTIYVTATNQYHKNQKILHERPVSGDRFIVQNHLMKLYNYYGDEIGVRIARKHIA